MEYFDREKYDYSEFLDMILAKRIKLSDVLGQQKKAWFYTILEPINSLLIERSTPVKGHNVELNVLRKAVKTSNVQNYQFQDD